MAETTRYVRPPSAESRGEAQGRGRLRGRRILVVGGGQQTFDAATDPIGNGRAMSMLFAREGARVGVADRDAASATATVDRIRGEGGEAMESATSKTDFATSIAIVVDMWAPPSEHVVGVASVARSRHEDGGRSPSHQLSSRAGHFAGALQGTERTSPATLEQGPEPSHVHAVQVI
jgi:NAD(P)-dependent dehydrogenase (short-subunit alcohol dehydrogenase family)